MSCLFAILALSLNFFLPAEGPVYLIPIEGEISPGLIHPVQRGLEEAKEQKAAAIIFLLDTPGGRVDATMEIIDLIEENEIPNWTLVDDWALSAGAFIAVATDHIYMTPGSVIGAATPVISSPTGGATEIPEAVEEKMTSALTATIAATAEAHGHSPDLVRAMVDRDIEIPDPKHPGEFISRAGKLLTLTAPQARELGLTDGTVANLDELLVQLGFSEARRIYLQLSPAEKLSRFLTSSTITVILLLGGLAGIYLEIKSPGFGLPGILGISCLILFFFGQYIGGLAGYEEIILFLIGASLLGIEIFVTPGFGLAGGAGIVLAATSLVMAMSRGPIFSEDFVINPDYPRAIQNLGLALLGLIGVIFVTSRLLAGKGSALSRRLVLTTNEQDFSSSEPFKLPHPGQTGIALTVLRPVGKADFGQRPINVVTRGEFIPAGKKVQVLKVEGNRVVVCPGEIAPREAK